MSAGHDIQDPELEAFRRRVREALVAPEGWPLATLLPAPLVTALVVDAHEEDPDGRLESALVEVSAALQRVGVPVGRQFALLGGAPGAKARLDGMAVLRRWLTVLRHDPARSFTAGRTPAGVPIELDDELREAEAIVCIGRCEAAAGRVHGGPYLLVPGVASQATRQAFAARRAQDGERGAMAFALAAEAAAPVDLALTWDGMGHNVRAGRGRTLFAALAREAGLD